MEASSADLSVKLSWTFDEIINILNSSGNCYADLKINKVLKKNMNVFLNIC